ncbi:MAG: hypothetical protein AAF790_05565 [Planctomycetota bacterium]
MTKAEAAFAGLMSGATLVGRFTLGSDDVPKPERYELGTVRKVGDGAWLIQARIRYGKNDVTLPITLPVQWAGDAAVIVVDNVGFPGLGTYSARVMIHGRRYAGYWQGSGYGGHLFGVIEPAAAPAKNAAPADKANQAKAQPATAEPPASPAPPPPATPQPSVPKPSAAD